MTPAGEPQTEGTPRRLQVGGAGGKPPRAYNRRVSADRPMNSQSPRYDKARAALGLDPVQRLNARENAAGSENPTRYAVSFTETFFPLR